MDPSEVSNGVKGKGKGKGKGKSSARYKTEQDDCPSDSNKQNRPSDETYNPRAVDEICNKNDNIEMTINSLDKSPVAEGDHISDSVPDPEISSANKIKLDSDYIPHEQCNELDPIDLSNTSSLPINSGVRYSVIVCSNAIGKNHTQSTLRTESGVKNVDSAKKVLFANDSVTSNSFSNERKDQDQWKNWRWTKEIENNISESPNIKLICKDDRDCEENCSETSDICSERTRLCRKRLLGTPKFTLAKKACSETFDPNELVDSSSEDPQFDSPPCPPDLNEWLETYDSWRHMEKNVALYSLISRASITHVRYMMETIEPLFQTDFISLLPKELALIILAHLEPEDLSRVAQTCRYWRFLANDNLLWKKLCHQAGITSIKPTVFSLPSTSPWKWAYANQHMIESNWRTKPALEAITMRGHDDHVITCLQCYGNKIVSGSDDTTLKVWSTITGECLQTLTGHAGGVWSCQMIDDTVVSGSTDRTLRVWNAVTGKCTSVLGGHTSTVRCMRLYKNKVVSGSRDTTLRVWLLPQGRCLQVLVGHMAAVRCVQYDGKLVVSGAYDFCVKVWNPDTGECLHTLTGHSNRVYTLKFDGTHIVSGSLDTSIRVWEAATGQLKHTLIGHTSLITSMEMQDNILVSGNADSTLKVWDINTGQCLHTLAGAKKHQLSVTYVQLLKRFVVSSSDDGTVKLWDLRTGEFIRNIVQLASGGAGGNVLRIRATNTQLVCAVGSRNGTEETKLMLMKFDRQNQCQTCNVYLDH